MMPKIIFTGGGSSGHVTPNIAIIQALREKNWDISYVGSKTGIEKILIEPLKIPYYSITTDKLRRQLTWRNLLIPFNLTQGLIEAFLLCRKLKPDLVFSKGGFVALPVVFGAWLNRIPVIAHESDLTPGLANRLSFPFAKKICVTFPEGKKYFKDSQKVMVTGTPIRKELFAGDANKGREFCGFSTAKPILLIMGGGLGSDVINKAIQRNLPRLLELFQIIHLCGKGKVNAELNNMEGYKQFAYITDELPDLLACADVVVSRAGANSLYELLVLRKPHLLIPLSKKASRGDQILNAQYFQQQGLSQVLFEEELTDEKLLVMLKELNANKTTIIEKLNDFAAPDSTKIICNIINELT